MKNRAAAETIRLWAFLAVGLSIFAVLGTRLFQLQVLQWPEFREKSDHNRFRLIEIVPPRGVLRDRAGRLLVTNRTAYSCYGVPRELWRDPRGMELLNDVLGMPAGVLAKDFVQPNRRSFVPIRLKRDLSFAELSAFEELRDQFPGAFLEVEQKRSYTGKLAPHLVGYVSEVAKEELGKFPDLVMGDLVGKRGLERIYDANLRGIKGRRFSMVNALGQEVGQAEHLHSIPPEAGNELWLTLDLNLQMLAESLLTGKVGAIVALNVRTGGVLAMASSPSYDPEIFAGRLDPRNWAGLMRDPQKPMLNRAVQTMYPPGSTIKMAMLIEGLESGAIDKDWTVSCAGGLQVGDRRFKCWKKEGHGRVNSLRAIEGSCDVYFYRLGLQIGADGVYRALTRFHFGRPTGVDQTSEAAGLVPSVEYYDRRYGVGKWTKGFIPSISIGQGEVLSTPMQLCAYALAMANGGIWRQPYLVQGIYDPRTQRLERIPVQEPQAISAHPDIIELAREGMIRVIWGDAGTARGQRDPDVKIAGKTGTSQNPHGEDHAWFIGFAPVDNPIIASCVLVEFGEGGSKAAAPLSRELMKRFVLAETAGDRPPEDVAEAMD